MIRLNKGWKLVQIEALIEHRRFRVRLSMSDFRKVPDQRPAILKIIDVELREEK